MALGFNSSGSYRVPCRCKVSRYWHGTTRQGWSVMKRYLVSVFLTCLCIVGCKAQTQCTTATPCTAPPIAATYQVDLSWTAPSTCTVSTPCTYAGNHSCTVSAFGCYWIECNTVSQTNWIGAFIAVGFIAYIIMRGQLTGYLQVLGLQN